jgi:pyruvate dehydrogenase E2 component (dihydrolipoamide acetyltransferase)
MINQLTIPELGKNIESITVVKVSVQPGATVAVDQALIEVETGKAVAEVPSTVAGTIKQILVAVGDPVKSGQPFAVVETVSGTVSTSEAAAQEPGAAALPVQPKRAEPVSAPAVAPPPAPRLAEMPVPGRHVPAAPSVRRFAREIGIDVDTVRGTAPHGRVSIEDVKRHAREMNAARQAGAAGPSMEQPPLPDFGQWGPIRSETMSAIRFATAAQVMRCWTFVPRVTNFDQADITEIEKLRTRYADRASALGGKLTMAVMVVKVCALALKRFPKVNASVDIVRRQIVFKDYVHIGLAVATKRGLLVPVIRDADRKNMVELAAEISKMAEQCREGKVRPEQLEGGTFTVTNLGRIGGSHFTPIVNYPEVAILGMGRATGQVVIRDGKPESRMMLPLSLSYDHRLIDGADAATFVRWVAEAVEQPLLLALEG